MLLRKIHKKMKRTLAMLLATVLVSMIIVPYLPPFPVKAAEEERVTLTSAFGDTNLGHKLYCIDKGGYAVWGVADDGDVYEKHSVSNAEVPLSSTDARYIFWAMLTLKASLGDQKAGNVIMSINIAAPAKGLPRIDSFVTEEDLKTIIYSAATRAKYPWIEMVAANSEEYMKLGGLITGGGGSTVGGKKVPDVIAANTTPASAYLIDKSTLTIQFAADGSDADFIQTVPIKFSNNGGASFDPTPTDGWTYTKTDTSIIFTNPNPKPPQALIQFDVAGTPYASAGGGYSSVEDVLESTLQIWECVTCSGGHVGNSPATLDPWLHQRMVWLDIGVVPTFYFASLAGDPTPESGGGSIQFKVYRHEEDFTSTYNVQLEKYDHETGKPLQGSRFVLYERFDDKDEVDTERDGPVHLYEGGGEYTSNYMLGQEVLEFLNRPVRLWIIYNAKPCIIKNGLSNILIGCGLNPQPIRLLESWLVRYSILYDTHYHGMILLFLFIKYCFLSRLIYS